MDKTKMSSRLTNIKQRCYNPNNQDYPTHGGRGITVDERWLDPVQGLDNFMADMGPWPGPGYTIDRIDTTGHYCKENCRWATNDEQYANRSKGNIQYYDIDGVQLSSREICEIVGGGCTPVVIAARYKRGSRGKDLLKPIVVATQYPTPHGPMTTGEIAKMTGVPRQTITVRLKSNPNITWDELTRGAKQVAPSNISATHPTMLGPLTKAQIAKIGGIGESTATRRLDKGMTGTELFLTHHQNDPVYIKYYGYRPIQSTWLLLVQAYQ